MKFLQYPAIEPAPQFAAAVRVAKLATIFLLIFVVGASATDSYSQSLKLTLNMRNARLSEVFARIESQSEYSFLYSPDELDLSRKVSVRASEASISDVLSTVLNGHDIAYRIDNRHIILYRPEAAERSETASAAAARQNPVTIKGKVTDGEGLPVAMANVRLKGSDVNVSTDAEGNYSITLIGESSAAVLVFSFVGFVEKEELIGSRTVLDVQLEDEVSSLEAIVVVGYGTQVRREITGSVTQISPKDFNQGFSNNAADLMKGKIAGLTITNGSGDVTSGSSIRLRGVSTLQNDQGPFIVVDGIPDVDMSTVSSQDIESISVLKDASSAAIYGSRSAGGVILITTKRGIAARPRINYTGAIGVSTLANKPNLMNADQWRASLDLLESEQKEAGRALDLGARTDWFDEITRRGFQQDHAVSVAGGGAQHTYRGAASYMQRDGLARDNYLKRYNMRLQFSQYALRNRLRIDMTGVMTLTDDSPAYDRNFLLAYNMLPVWPVKNADGSWFDSRNYDQGNPVRNQTENYRENQTNNTYGTISANLDIVEGLSGKLMLAKSRTSNDYSMYNSRNSEAGRSNGGLAQRSAYVDNMNLLELTGNYSKKFGRHKLDAMAGYSWERDNHAQHMAQNRTFVTDMLGANNLNSGQGLKDGDVASSKSESTLISFFARASYNYDGKYVLTASLRRDGSSKFGLNNKWGNFPSVSAAWNISEEKFLRDVSWIDNLKLRTGYGVMGNQAGLNPYKTLSLYGLSDSKYYDNGSWKTAYEINQNANPDLRWERTAMFNLGVDFQLFSGRINGVIEWYSKKTADMLYEYDVPTPPYKYNKMMANVGDMLNTGIEISLSANAVRTQNFSWTVSLTLSHNKNKITSLSNDVYTADKIPVGSIFWRGGEGTTHILEVGRPVGQFYGLRCERLDENGHYIYVDQDANGEIHIPSDNTYIGDANPDVEYGLSNAFRFRNWDLSFFLRGTLGNDLLNVPRIQYAQMGFLPGTNALNDPLVYRRITSPAYSSYYIEDGSYLRLDNISVGYNINWLNGVRIYATAQNLFVITGYKGLDPEVPVNINNGLAPGVEAREFYPKARIFSLGLSLNF